MGLASMTHFIKDLKNTGAIASCSSSVAKLLCTKANLSACDSIVELGSGTGAITKAIEKSVSSDALFFAMELNPEFAKKTQKRCPNTLVYADSAENIKQYLQKHGRETCDCIISTLPWTLFSEDMQQKILGAILEVLPAGGQFLTVTYTFSKLFPGGMRFKNKLKDNFRSIQRTKTVWRNLPPVFAYHCTK